MIFADKTPIEGEAIRQFEAVLALPGIIEGAGFPDLHPGRGVPVGAAFRSEKFIYPHLIGNDIGCGMSLYRLGIPVRKFRVDKLMRRFTGDIEDMIRQISMKYDSICSEAHRSALGTIGHGNHFIEFLAVESTFNDVYKDDSIFVLVHCGSRGYGEMLWRKVTAKYGNSALDPESADGRDYLRESNDLINWARYNRSLVAQAMAEMVKGDAILISDSAHNGIFIENPLSGHRTFIHRKGATEIIADKPVMVAGSRGTHSYLVQGLNKAGTLSTLAHGCGRKYQRGDARSRLKDRYRKEESQKTSIGSWVICPDKDTLYEEAPEAYKNINTVIEDLETLGLAIPWVRFKPLLNIKP